jgi:hypothetical protein
MAATVTTMACSASSGGEGGDGGAASLCATLTEYQAHCHPTDPCTLATEQRCSAHMSDYSAAYAAVMTECYSAPYDCTQASTPLASVCVSAGVHTATPTAAQAKVKSDFCARCPDDPSPLGNKYCSNFYGSTDSIGSIVLRWNDTVASEVDRHCTSTLAVSEAGADGGASVDCSGAFLRCAAGVIPSLPAACQASVPDGGGPTPGLLFGLDGG